MGLIVFFLVQLLEDLLSSDLEHQGMRFRHKALNMKIRNEKIMLMAFSCPSRFLAFHSLSTWSRLVDLWTDKTRKGDPDPHGLALCQAGYGLCQTIPQPLYDLGVDPVNVR